MVTEHTLEVRHDACGKFLDVRGYIADHIRASDLFPHWQIETNVVSFTDLPHKADKIGAFAGFKSAGLFSFDPDTRNYFEDQAGKFWKALNKNQFYTIPNITRFGCRTKAFLNSNQSFDEINKTLYSKFFSTEFKSLIGDKEDDFQIIVELLAGKFNLRIVIGPLHEGEARRFFNFDSEHFEEAGIFIDLDIYKTSEIQCTEISSLTKESMKLAWERIDSISSKAGF